MTTTDLKQFARDFLRTLDRQDWDAARALAAPGVRSHVGGASLDREGWIGMGKMFYGAFPDARHEIEDVVADGDRVVARCVFRGTHRGDFQGVPASGRAVSMPAIVIYRVAEGRVVEHWGQFDAVGLMQQIGALPAQG